MRASLRAGQYAPACWQCGKFNQNVKLAAKVRERFGAAVYESLTGRSAKQASDNAIGKKIALRVIGNAGK
jgi:hypothetical protein